MQDTAQREARIFTGFVSIYMAALILFGLLELMNVIHV
jgi:hypothetical protein